MVWVFLWGIELDTQKKAIGENRYRRSSRIKTIALETQKKAIGNVSETAIGVPHLFTEKKK